MSSLIIEVCRVDSVRPHPNADRMAVARIKGWEVCVAKNIDGEPWVKEGDKVVYFPPESVIPAGVAEKHGVTKYLAPLPKREDGTRPTGGRVKVANLRGFKSFGYLAAPDDSSWPVGLDVAEYYSVTKYEPPMRATQEDAHKDSPEFPPYYEMENLRNFPNTFEEGEQVYVTEKIHGENCRLGLIREVNDEGVRVWRWAAGSNGVRRKRYAHRLNKDGSPRTPIESVYWKCFTPEIKAMLCALSSNYLTPEEVDAETPVRYEPDGQTVGVPVVLYGERFGCGVQDMWYGRENGKVEFRAFDVAVEDTYVSACAKEELFRKYNVPMVPFVYSGPYSFEGMEYHTEGTSMLSLQDKADVRNFKEGIVICSATERVAEYQRLDKPSRFGRAQVKLISFAYLDRKGGTEFK